MCPDLLLPSITAPKDNTYSIFKSGSSYIAVKASDGSVTSSTAFASVFQAIIDTIPTRDNTVFTKIKLGPGSFVIDATITIGDKYNVHIEGSGQGITRLDAGSSLSASQRVWNIFGSVSGTGKNLTANTTAKTKTVTMSGADASTFSVGDWAFLRSSALHWSGGVAKKGEIKQITAVDGGTGVVSFRSTLFDTYATADTANLIKLLPARNIKFSDVTIGKASGYTDDGRWLYFQFVDDVQLENVTMEDPAGAFSSGIVLVSCINSRIDSCHLILNNAATANDQYGIAINNCSQNIVISNCTASGKYRHPFEAAATFTGTDMEGVTRSVTFSNCTSRDAINAAFDTHHGGEGIAFIGCSIQGKADLGGALLRARRSKVDNCFFHFVEDNPAISVSEDAFEAEISNNTIIKPDHEGIHIQDGLDFCKITGNIIQDASNNGIKLDAGADATLIANNTIRNCDVDAVDITTSIRCVLIGNVLNTNSGWGIDLSAGDCTETIIVGNNLNSNSSGAIDGGGQTGNMELGNTVYTPNLVTEIFKVIKDTASGHITIYRPNSGGATGVEVLFRGNNSTPAETTYARIREEIVTNTAASEDGRLRFSVVKGGTLTESLRINETGALDIGTNLRLRTRDDLLTAQRTFDWADIGTVGGANPRVKSQTHDYFEMEDEFTCASISLTNTSNAIGVLNWGISNSTGGTPTVTAGVAAHPGIVTITTGATSGNNCRLHLTDAAATAFLIPTDVERYAWIVRIPTITSIIVRVGIMQDISAANGGTAGAFFQFSSAVDADNWQSITRQASTSTPNTITGVTVDAGDWFLLEAVRLSGGNWEFYVNNTLQFTHSTNLPTTACNIGVHTETATTAARPLDIDYFKLRTIKLGQRWT